MNQILRLSFAFIVCAAAIACNSSAKDKKSELSKKQAQLKKNKEEINRLNAEIKKLESDIIALDPAQAKAEQTKLVGLTPLTPETFTHFIDLQGRVEAENTYNVMPRGVPGQVRAVYVKEGDFVRKGQLLLKMDDAVYRQSIATARLGVASAQDVYNRYKNLRDQDIGTEVELIRLRSQLDQAKGQLAILQEQIDFTNVYSPMNGVAERVNIKVGETFTGSPVAGGITIINKSDLKVVTDIPETYVSRVKRGTPVEIFIPSLNRTINSKISLISQSIGATSRGFTVEAKLPSDPAIKANQVVTMKIQDYSAPNAITIPVSTVQTDENGKFVLVAKSESGKTIARKKPVGIGELYGDRIEIKTGLNIGDTLITQGFQNLYEGQRITTVK